jgi:ribosome-associated protein
VISNGAAGIDHKDIPAPVAELLQSVEGSLEADQAEDIVVIDLFGKSSLADYMVVASGRSSRQVNAMSDHLAESLKHGGHSVRIEGLPQCDWVLLDVGDVIVHLFRPDVRAFYNLEKMWSAMLPESEQRAV